MKVRLLSCALSAALVLSLTGCACCRPKPKRAEATAARAEGRGAAPVSAPMGGMIPSEATIGHWVFFWLKEPGDAEGRRTVAEAARTLRDIPGVVAVHVGTMLPSDNPAVDSTYDVGMLVLFTDVEALRAYEHHPIHQNAAAKIGPVVEKAQVYDFTIE